MTVRTLAMLGLWIGAAAAAGQGNGYPAADEKKATGRAVEFAEFGSWVWRVAIIAGGVALVGAVFARRVVRARATGAVTADPWIRAKLEGGPLPGTLTRMEESDQSKTV